MVSDLVTSCEAAEGNKRSLKVAQVSKLKSIRALGGATERQLSSLIARDNEENFFSRSAAGREAIFPPTTLFGSQPYLNCA